MSKYDRSKREKTIRKDSYAIACIFTYILMLIFRIPLVHLIGEKGVGYYGIVYELFMVLTFFFSYGLSEATATMVRYRTKREQYKNADKVLKSAISLACVIGGMICFVMFLGGQVIADKIMQMSVCKIILWMMAPAVFFHILTGVFRGYFQGNGSKVPAIHSKILETVILFLGGIIGAILLYRYGGKVSALLMNQSFAAVYGALGATIGVLVASVICFLHILVLFFIYKRGSKRNEFRDSQKYVERQSHIIHIIIGTALPYAAFGCLFHAITFVDAILFMHFSKTSQNPVLTWGNYYGKCLPVVGIICVILSLLSLEPVRRFVFLAEREEYRVLKERMRTFIHQCMIWTMPSIIFTAVLSSNILSLFFEGSNADSANYLMWASIGIVFYVFGITFSHMFLRQRKIKYVVISGGIALVLHIMVIVILLQKTKLDMIALIIGNIVFYAVLTIIGFIYIIRNYQYTQEWIRSVAFPIASAGITGLIVMLLNKAFVPMTGEVISLCICLPVGILVYIILLLAIRSLNERELENMFMGRILIKIGKVLHFM